MSTILIENLRSACVWSFIYSTIDVYNTQVHTHTQEVNSEWIKPFTICTQCLFSSVRLFTHKTHTKKIIQQFEENTRENNKCPFITKTDERWASAVQWAIVITNVESRKTKHKYTQSFHISHTFQRNLSRISWIFVKQGQLKLAIWSNVFQLTFDAITSNCFFFFLFIYLIGRVKETKSVGSAQILNSGQLSY